MPEHRLRASNGETIVEWMNKIREKALGVLEEQRNEEEHFEAELQHERQRIDIAKARHHELSEFKNFEKLGQLISQPRDAAAGSDVSELELEEQVRLSSEEEQERVDESIEPEPVNVVKISSSDESELVNYEVHEDNQELNLDVEIQPGNLQNEKLEDEAYENGHEYYDELEEGPEFDQQASDIDEEDEEEEYEVDDQGEFGIDEQYAEDQEQYNLEDEKEGKSGIDSVLALNELSNNSIYGHDTQYATAISGSEYGDFTREEEIAQQLLQLTSGGQVGNPQEVNVVDDLIGELDNYTSIDVLKDEAAEEKIEAAEAGEEIEVDLAPEEATEPAEEIETTLEAVIHTPLPDSDDDEDDIESEKSTPPPPPPSIFGSINPFEFDTEVVNIAQSLEIRPTPYVTEIRREDSIVLEKVETRPLIEEETSFIEKQEITGQSGEATEFQTALEISEVEDGDEVSTFFKYETAMNIEITEIDSNDEITQIEPLHPLENIAEDELSTEFQTEETFDQSTYHTANPVADLTEITVDSFLDDFQTANNTNDASAISSLGVYYDEATNDLVIDGVEDTEVPVAYQTASEITIRDSPVGHGLAMETSLKESPEKTVRFDDTVNVHGYQLETPIGTFDELSESHNELENDATAYVTAKYNNISDDSIDSQLFATVRDAETEPEEIPHFTENIIGNKTFLDDSEFTINQESESDIKDSNLTEEIQSEGSLLNVSHLANEGDAPSEVEKTEDPLEFEIIVDVNEYPENEDNDPSDAEKGEDPLESEIIIDVEEYPENEVSEVTEEKSEIYLEDATDDFVSAIGIQNVSDDTNSKFVTVKEISETDLTKTKDLDSKSDNESSRETGTTNGALIEDTGEDLEQKNDLKDDDYVTAIDITLTNGEISDNAKEENDASDELSKDLDEDLKDGIQEIVNKTDEGLSSDKEKDLQDNKSYSNSSDEEQIIESDQDIIQVEAPKLKRKISDDNESSATYKRLKTFFGYWTPWRKENSVTEEAKEPVEDTVDVVKPEESSEFQHKNTDIREPTVKDEKEANDVYEAASEVPDLEFDGELEIDLPLPSGPATDVEEHATIEFTESNAKEEETNENNYEVGEQLDKEADQIELVAENDTQGLSFSSDEEDQLQAIDMAIAKEEDFIFTGNRGSEMEAADGVDHEKSFDNDNANGENDPVRQEVIVSSNEKFDGLLSFEGEEIDVEKINEKVFKKRPRRPIRTLFSWFKFGSSIAELEEIEKELGDKEFSKLEDTYVSEDETEENRVNDENEQSYGDDEIKEQQNDNQEVHILVDETDQIEESLEEGRGKEQAAEKDKNGKDEIERDEEESEIEENEVEAVSEGAEKVAVTFDKNEEAENQVTEDLKESVVSDVEEEKHKSEPEDLEPEKPAVQSETPVKANNTKTPEKPKTKKYKKKAPKKLTPISKRLGRVRKKPDFYSGGDLIPKTPDMNPKKTRKFNTSPRRNKAARENETKKMNSDHIFMQTRSGKVVGDANESEKELENKLMQDIENGNIKTTRAIKELIIENNSPKKKSSRRGKRRD